MKTRILLSLSMLAVSMLTISAQNVVSGTVTDKKGNPIAGAKVENPKTQQSVLTDPDGTFSMSVDEMPQKLKVQYVGMASKKVKASSNMNVKMKELYKLHLNVRAGIGMSDFVSSSDGTDHNYSYKKKVAWKCAIEAELEPLPNFFVMESISLSLIKVKRQYSSFDDGNATLYPIRLSSMVGYQFNLSDNFGIRPKIGAYYEYVCGGFHYFSENYLKNKVCIGAEAGVDFNYKNILLGINMEYGFTPMIYDSISYGNDRNLIAGFITIGYRFGPFLSK